MTGKALLPQLNKESSLESRWPVKVHVLLILKECSWTLSFLDDITATAVHRESNVKGSRRRLPWPVWEETQLQCSHEQSDKTINKSQKDNKANEVIINTRHVCLGRKKRKWKDLWPWTWICIWPRVDNSLPVGDGRISGRMSPFMWTEAESHKPAISEQISNDINFCVRCECGDMWRCLIPWGKDCLWIFYFSCAILCAEVTISWVAVDPTDVTADSFSPSDWLPSDDFTHPELSIIVARFRAATPDTDGDSENTFDDGTHKDGSEKDSILYIMRSFTAIYANSMLNFVNIKWLTPFGIIDLTLSCSVDQRTELEECEWAEAEYCYIFWMNSSALRYSKQLFSGGGSISGYCSPRVSRLSSTRRPPSQRAVIHSIEYSIVTT